MATEHEWIEKREAVTVVHLASEYGSADVHTLTDAETLLSQQAEEAQPPLLVLDLADTEYFGSEFINILLRCYSRLNERHGHFALCNVQPVPLEELRVTHLDSLWPIYSTPSEAIRALGQGV